MKEDGNVKDQYDILSNEGKSNEFKIRYIEMNPEIALERSTTGKYVARKLSDMEFDVQMVNTSQVSFIFKTIKKNDKEDLYKLAKLL